jgi:hypothetical protein
MHIREIAVSADKTIPHPPQGYSSLRADVTRTASLEPGEDWPQQTAQLQALARQHVQAHLAALSQPASGQKESN